jgi:SNF2 family DNA or RNA helicase/intein/homing endonuclease
VLHAAWLAPPQFDRRWLALWAEVETAPPLRRRAPAPDAIDDRIPARSHPFAARYDELRAALDRLWRTARPSVRPRTSHTRERLTLWLPSVGNRPLPSPELVRAGWAVDPRANPLANVTDPARTPLRAWRVATALLDAEAAAVLLTGLPYAPGAALSSGEAGAAAMRLGGDLRLWSAAGAFALDLLVRQRYVPGAREVSPRSYDFYRSYSGHASGPRVAGFWFAALGEPEVRARFDALAAAMPDLCRAGQLADAPESDAPRPLLARALLEDFLHIAVNACIADWLRRDDIHITPPVIAPPPVPPKSRYTFGSYGSQGGYGSAGYRTYGSSAYYPPRTLAGRWLQSLAAPNSEMYAAPDEARILLDGLRGWHAGLSAASSPTFRLCFRLSPPDSPAEDENENSDAAGYGAAAAPPGPEGMVAAERGAGGAPAWQMPRLIVTPGTAQGENGAGAVRVKASNGAEPSPNEYANGANAPASESVPQSVSQVDGEPADEADEAGGLWRLDYLLQALDDPSLLVPLEEIWRERGSIARFVDRRFDHPHKRVLAGLGQAARLFAPIDASLKQAHPIGCDLSGAEAYAFLTEALPQLEEAGFGVLAPPWWKRVEVKPTVRLRLKGPQTSTGLMGLDAIVGFDYQVALGGEELSREELERLAALKEPLVRLRGKWVELRPEQVEAALKFLRTHGGTLSLADALRVSLTGQVGAEGEETVELEEVSADGWIGDLLGRLRQGDTIAEAPQPEALQGALRPYQRRGQNWLSFLSQYGLGACLADDMGLGKCLIAGRLISTAVGPRPIESFWEYGLSEIKPEGEGGEWGELTLPVPVHTFDGREITTVPVHRIYRQQINEPCVEVRLGDGSHLTSTKRHRYLTPAGWKMAAELQVGDLVAVPSRTPHTGANAMPAEIAELMAWQLAEGYEFGHSGRFYSADTAIMGRFCELARQVGVALWEPRWDRTSLCVGTGGLYDVFKPWGYDWGHKSAGKIVPQSVLEAPLESQRAFIQALFDAEGHVGKTHCELTMASEQVIYALQTMLRNFGVWARIRRAMKAATNGTNIKRPYYMLTFGGNSVQRFAEQFTLCIPYKQEALVKLAAIPHNSSAEGVPTQAVIAAMQERRILLRSVGLRTVYEWRGMGRELAASVATQLRDKGHPDLAGCIEELGAPGIYWCEVKQIAEVAYQGYVYDLEVPGTHNYIANGIVTHNTAELLALVLHQKAQGQLTKPVLLVCPTSVVGNWEHETTRFAPTLRVLTHHGAARAGRKRAARFAEEVAGYDLVLTTYSLLPRDEVALNSVQWGAVVLDEAQNIKNAEAKQSRAARHLSAPVRVALTGTPVENRLAELWSIMDFLNPGYLGSHKRFHERFAAPIEQQRDQTAMAQLQSLMRPFVLRRLKTDPNVIRDLPEKLEIREYCPLTREQVTLYEAVVRDGLRTLEQAESPMQRRGVILAMLSKLKQVCNHPAHLLGDGSALKGRSGKLTRLEELIEELLSEGDRALIFTQFTAMGDRLQPYLAERFGVDVLYLHGGVAQRERVKLIDRFQAEGGPPLFLLSLKAGGTGLNLTAANHVIHFDRWWNPAVENQATDRAFRIGQTRNVQVRKFVCSGTLEERIDAMIEQKRALAEQVIGTGEAWLTELSTAQLRDLFSLRASALAQ